MNIHMVGCVWVASISLLAGCSQGVDANDSSASPLEAGAETRSLAARIGNRTEAEALLKDRAYIEARAITEGKALELDQRVARNLNLDASETNTFLAIMSEHRAARLAMQDVLTKSRGLSRTERADQMRTGVDAATAQAASPAFVQRRIAKELGEARVQAYRELLRTGDRWRFSQALGARSPSVETSGVSGVRATPASVQAGAEQNLEAVK